jgi:hypothetical protein
MALVLPAGSTAAVATLTSGSPGASTAISYLISIGGTTYSKATADVTGLSDTTIQRLPSRVDLGTVQLTIFLDDTVTASNQYTSLKARLTNGTHTRITIGLPGANIDDLYVYDGYITEVSSPEIGASDDALRYTVTLQLSDKY